MYQSFKTEIKTIVIVSIIAVIIATGGIWFLKTLQPSSNSTPNEQQVVNNQQSAIDTSNWQIYRNDELGFQMKYPEDWMVVSSTQGSLIGYFRKESLEAEGPRGSQILIHKNPQGITGSNVQELKEDIDDYNLEQVGLRGWDETDFLERYKSSIKKIGGFNVVLAEGEVDDLGYAVPLLSMYVLLENNDILLFTGFAEEPYKSMFESLRNEN